MNSNKYTLTYILCIFLVVMGYCTPALAEKYDLVSGKKHEICKNFMLNLDSLATSGSMACGISIDSKNKDFSKPKWKPINESEREKYLSIIRDAYERKEKRFYWPGDNVKLWMANFDIGNDGNNQIVLKLEDENCNPKKQERHAFPISSNLYVLKTNKRSLDPRFDRLLGERSLSVVMYKNKSYLAGWNGVQESSNNAEKNLVGYLKLYDVFMTQSGFGIGNYPICKYSYIR